MQVFEPWQVNMHHSAVSVTSCPERPGLDQCPDQQVEHLDINILIYIKTEIRMCKQKSAEKAGHVLLLIHKFHLSETQKASSDTNSGA